MDVIVLGECVSYDVRFLYNKCYQEDAVGIHRAQVAADHLRHCRCIDSGSENLPMNPHETKGNLFTA